MERLLLPDSPEVQALYGGPGVSRRATRERLRRAEAAGILPPRRFLSSQRFCYVASEFEAAVARLLGAVAPNQETDVGPKAVPPAAPAEGLARASETRPRKARKRRTPKRA